MGRRKARVASRRSAKNGATTSEEIVLQRSHAECQLLMPRRAGWLAAVRVQLLGVNPSDILTLPWLTRIKIAVGAAKGLAFLHGEDKPVIYRDFKTSNILLDSDFKAKLSDFGLAKDGPEGDETHVSTRVMGTHGYAAPEYVMTGHLTTITDVYSFGVVLLELLTGKRAMDKNRPPREQNLVEWAKPFLKDHHKLERIMDPRLEGQYSTAGAKKVAALAHQCLSHYPKSRPNMNHVVKVLEPILDFSDIPFGSFVYVAPTMGKTDKKLSGKLENEAELKENGNQEKGEVKKDNGFKEIKKGYRHVHRIRSRAVFSDTALYKNELKSPRKKGN
ncbi:hypothetical protein BUALT_Bualt07G0165000 [Buddleja alternifolia]|uniref:Protein kinase domain-containing protein n=1 Tax=Buddleja alternifolia TaxID=168488 RepID=A0AAV6XJ13_9LAMI|nr:hypothetical protein BUALT_Bualt07G0165000 [Buddleja alternifolia]